MKKLIIISVLLLILGCSNKKNLEKLNQVMKKVDTALVSDDRDYIKSVINELSELEPLFKEHRSLRKKKTTLQIRIHDYLGAIETIDSLTKIDIDEIDYRIIKGILEEIEGLKKESINTFEQALHHLNERIESEGFRSKDVRIYRRVNRVMVLKLLSRDKPEDYDDIIYDFEAYADPDIIKAVKLLRDGDREDIINRYRY